MSVPINVFTRNVQSILSALTSSDSPYAVADTPVSIVLITPGPCLPSMFPDPAKKEWCTQDSMRKYRDAVLEVGKEWKSKEAEQATARGWSIETVDAWGSVVGQAGGQAEELRPYFKYGRVVLSSGPCAPSSKADRLGMVSISLPKATRPSRRGSAVSSRPNLRAGVSTGKMRRTYRSVHPCKRLKTSDMICFCMQANVTGARV